MTPLSFTALIRRVIGCLIPLVSSPFDYVKELLVFAVVIASASWTIGTVQGWLWNGGSSTSTASAEQPSISKLLVSAEEIVLFRDFREIAAIDESGEILDLQPVFNPEHFHLARDAAGWSFLSIDCGRNVMWRHSAWGDLPCESDLPNSMIRDATLSADGMSVAVLYRHHGIVIWNRTEDRLPVCRRWPMTLEIDQINLSPRGNKLAIKTMDHKLCWMETRTGTVQAPVQPDVELPVSFAWSRDERWYATAMEDHRILVWKTEASPEPLVLTVPRGIPMSMSLSADGRWLIAGLSTGDIMAWHDGELAWSKSIHRGGIRALDLADDDHAIVSASLHGRLLVHAIETGELLREIQHLRD